MVLLVAQLAMLNDTVPIRAPNSSNLRIIGDCVE